LNYGHCLIDIKYFGINIAYFIMVGKTRSSVFWCGACFGAGIRLRTPYEKPAKTNKLFS